MSLVPTTPLRRALAAALLAASASGAPAQVTLSDAWVRGTVPSQKTTGMFGRIASTVNVKIVEVRSPVAGIVEIHEMAMQGDVMHMRPMAALAVPAGGSVDLKPGGYHVMLMDLKQALKPGDTVPLTLVVEGADGRRAEFDATAVVRALDGTR